MTDTLKETHELITPVITGTPEERVEALNLWTTLVTTLKKMSELPSNENKLALLRGSRDQAECDLDRITNVNPIPAPVPMAEPTTAQTVAPTAVMPELTPAADVPDYYEQLDSDKQLLTRIEELAGLKVRPL